jgi:TolB protein
VRGTIAFAAACTNSGELQAIEADGSRRRTLIKDFFDPGYSDPVPSWSPDGTRLAFADENGMLRLANADGSGVRDVFRAPPGSDSSPAWSPDGRRLVAVFSGTPPARTNPDLIESPVLEGIYPLRTPAWSPDRRHVVGIVCEDDCELLVVVDLATGAGERTIFEHHGAAFPVAPAWSPNGRWIAFGWLYGEGKSATTSILFYDVRKQTVVGEEGRVVGDHPSWAPDGKRLAVDTYFDYLHPERSSVFTARRDGSQRLRLARNASQPAWSPDGRKIVFVRIVGRANSELFVMNADGSRQCRLTFNPGPDLEPDWQPLPH